MHYAIKCPRCGLRNVQSAKKVWFINGFLLFARYGSRIRIGCEECVRVQLTQDLLFNLFGGWWCLPWGLATPFVVLQNLVALLSKSDVAELEGALLACGIDPADVRLDEYGFTSEQRRMVEAAFCVLSQSAYADGTVDPAEARLAIAVMTRLTQGRLTTTQISAGLRSHRHSTERLDDLPFEYRLDLMRMALSIILSDQVLSGEERAFFYQLGSRLGLDPAHVRRFLDEAMGQGVPGTSQDRDPSFSRACSVLGVGAHPTIAEIKQAFRGLMLRNHPDRSGTDPARKAASHNASVEINWAYEYLMREMAGAGVP
jgi:DnaJ-domain-containing protein 1